MSWCNLGQILDLLEPVLVHCAGSNTGFKSMENCCHVNQLPLSETVGMAGQWSCLIVPDRIHAISNVKGEKTNYFIYLKLTSLKFECFHFTGSTLSYLCRQEHQFSSERRTDQWFLAWRSSSWFGFDRFLWNKFYSQPTHSGLWQAVGLKGSLFCHGHCVGNYFLPISSHYCNCVKHGVSFYRLSLPALQDNTFINS